MKDIRTSFFSILSASLVFSLSAATVERDLVIYGSSSAAISAAVQAKRMGVSCVVVSPETRIGGLTTGGLGQTDIGNKSAFGGIALEFYRAVAKWYRDDSHWTRQKRSDYMPDGQCSGTKGEDSMWTFEPSAALAILEGWEKRDGLEIHRGKRLDRGGDAPATKNGGEGAAVTGKVASLGGAPAADAVAGASSPRSATVTVAGQGPQRKIVSFRTEDGTEYRAKMFIDATYEGDLLAAAGVSYFVGREANAKYGETLSGCQRKQARFHQFGKGVSAYVKPGDPKSGLLPYVLPDDGRPDGTGDSFVQSYCFRMCLTDDPENRIPFAKPANYDEKNYELLFRQIAAMPKWMQERDFTKPDSDWILPWINSKMPNRKTDTNNRDGFSTDFIGQNWKWAEGSYAEREKIRQAHLDYQRGLMWTLANHPRIPESWRKAYSRWGTCRDEFKNGLGDGWQTQLYVREARRMVGDYVMTEANCRGKTVAPRPVAMGAYGMDSHHVRRLADKDGFVQNEGDVEVSRDEKGQAYPPYPIDYGAIVPKRGECANLLVPVCVSASHIAFGSIRMEPVFFALGQAAATAAAQAIAAKCAVQDLPYRPLAARLRADGQGLPPQLMTPWGEKVTSANCWREYPRPQMVRANWTCLNGDWDYAITSVTNTPGRPTKWEGKIRVPYPIESTLSGVGRKLEPNEFLWYTRTIDVRAKKCERVLLHFDGVDFRAMVFIGHREVTDVPHAGAQEPFTLDITDYLPDSSASNHQPATLTVCVWDPTEGHVNSHGKQSLDPVGCFYTRCSGIWQSVWLETVPETYIADYNVIPDIDRGEVTFEVKVEGRGQQKLEISVLDAANGGEGAAVTGGSRSSATAAGKNGGEGAAVTGKGVCLGGAPAADSITLRLPRPLRLWSPESPNLYTFKATLGADTVTGYFAMRKFAKAKDAKGILRFFLNNKPYFVLGTLDQGWWPDGLLTPPSEEAMAHDIKTLKSCGFNTMRKHIKVEPRRYYALCDKLGLLVLQDLPSALDIAGGTGVNDPFAARSTFGYGFQRYELKAMIDNLRKVPSIVMWIPYNEGWSQPNEFLTHATLDWVKRYDPTRLVGGPSGSQDFEGGHLLRNNVWKWSERTTTPHKPAGVCEAGDTVDLHLYRGDNPGGLYGTHLIFPPNDRRVSFLGEFGGLGHPFPGHMWKEMNNWGYGGIDDTKTREGLTQVYVKMMADIAEQAKKGLSGSIYTQTTDVEIEINGLMTYDRKVLKMDAAVLKEAHRKIFESGTSGN